MVNLMYSLTIVALFSVHGSCDVLHLTPYIERGDITAGQQAAQVEPLQAGIISYSGFLTVDKRYDSNLFFWFFPAEQDDHIAPVMLWLQGGPGRSSLYGLFEKNGAYYIDDDNKLLIRQHYWSQVFNVIYIDNPVGAGFSYTRAEDGYSRNETHIGQNLYTAVKQFFRLFPKYRRNDFYLSGSSYGGKFVTVLAYTINRMEQQLTDEDQRIYLKGLIVGNGFFDPVTIVNRSEFLFQIGLIDEKCKTNLDRNISRLVAFIDEQRYAEALDYEDMIFRTLQHVTGYTSSFNYLHETTQHQFGDLASFLYRNRHSIHASNLPFQDYTTAYHYLKADIMQSVKPMFEHVLESYRILIYTGQMDLLVSYSSTVRFIQSLNWSAAEQYRQAVRELYYTGNQLAGYRKTAGLMTELLVRNAGHSAAADSPELILKIIKDFVSNTNCI